MKSRVRLWIVTLGLIVLTVSALNAALVLEIRDQRSNENQFVIDGTRSDPVDTPEYTTYLLFTPAQCSSQFIDQVRSWDSVFNRFHGSRVWVQPVAMYTSKVELGQFWDTVDFKLAVEVDPEGSLMDRLGVTALPAKVIVSHDGEVLYREQFPELYESGRLADVLRQLLERKS